MDHLSRFPSAAQVGPAQVNVPLRLIGTKGSYLDANMLDIFEHPSVLRVRYEALKMAGHAH